MSPSLMTASWLARSRAARALAAQHVGSDGSDVDNGGGGGSGGGGAGCNLDHAFDGEAAESMPEFTEL